MSAVGTEPGCEIEASQVNGGSDASTVGIAVGPGGVAVGVAGDGEPVAPHPAATRARRTTPTEGAWTGTHGARSRRLRPRRRQGSLVTTVAGDPTGYHRGRERAHRRSAGRLPVRRPRRRPRLQGPGPRPPSPLLRGEPGRPAGARAPGGLLPGRLVPELPDVRGLGTARGGAPQGRVAGPLACAARRGAASRGSAHARRWVRSRRRAGARPRTTGRRRRRGPGPRAPRPEPPPRVPRSSSGAADEGAPDDAVLDGEAGPRGCEAAGRRRRGHRRRRRTGRRHAGVPRRPERAPGASAGRAGGAPAPPAARRPTTATWRPRISTRRAGGPASPWRRRAACRSATRPSRRRRATAGPAAPGTTASDPAAPSWEQPRRFEDYPTLKSRGGVGIPRVALYALVVLLVGVALFAAPSLLKGLGGGGDDGEPHARGVGVGRSRPSEPSPTPVPTPEQVVYTVKSGDTLSKIARAVRCDGRRRSSTRTRRSRTRTRSPPATRS